MKEFLANRWFLLLLGLELVLGLAFPAHLLPVARSIPQDVVVATVLFLMALPLEARIMWRSLRQPKATLLALAINAVILPLVAWGLSFTLRGALAHGLMIAAAVPCTLASAAVWTRRAGGNEAVAMMVMIITNLACFLITPFWLVVTTGKNVEIDIAEMAAKLFWLVVLPIIAAQLIRLIRPIGAWGSRHKAPLSILAQCGILAIVLVGAVESGKHLSGSQADSPTALDWFAMLANVAGLHVAMLWLGLWLGKLLGLERPDRIAVGIAGSQKTLMIGLHSALQYYGSLAMLPMVAYHLCQLLIDTVVADRMRRSASTDNSEKQQEDVSTDDAGGHR